MKLAFISSFLILLVLLIVFIILFVVEKERNDQSPPVSTNGLMTPDAVIEPYFTSRGVSLPNTGRILCIGDSVTELGGNVPGYGTYPFQMASFSKGCSEAFIGGHISDPRLTLSNPTTMLSNNATLGGYLINLTDSGDSLKFAPTSKSFGYIVWMMTGPTVCNVQVTLSTTLFGESGTTTQSPITLTCYDPSLSTNQLRSFEVKSTAALKDAMYLTMTPVVASGRSAIFVGIETINAPGITSTVINAGLSGTTSNDIAVGGSAAFAPLNVISTLNPDVSVIMVGINDWYIARTDLSLFATNLRNIYTAAQSNGGKVLALTPVPSNPVFIASATQDTYVNVIRQVTTDMNIPLLDLYALWGNYSTTNDNNWMKDALHPNEKGLHELANAVRYALNY